MNNKEALEAFSRGQKLNQPTIKRLYRQGLVEVRDVTHLQSTEQEFLVTFLTKNGQRLLESRTSEATGRCRERACGRFRT